MTRLDAALVELAAALREEIASTSTSAPGHLPESLLNVDEAREVMGGIARSTLYELIRRDELRTVTVGRRRLVPSSAIADYAAANSDRP